jgi:8-oxo-dGTP diphosphatase
MDGMGAQEQGIDPTRWMVIPRTLCFITYENDVLLLKRAAHKRVFPNRYNGIGGHLERDEDPLNGALREIYEETGLAVHGVRFRGVYHIDAGQEVGIVLFVFTAVADSRDFTDSDEGTLEWVPIAEVNHLPLVDDLPLLLPRLFGPAAVETPFFAHVSYDNADQMVMKFAEQGS